MSNEIDVAIVGGGFAGTAAGITLARARKNTVIVDSGKPRNRFSEHTHGVLGRDGQNPLQILETGHSEFLSFGGELVKDTVIELRHNSSSNGWTLLTEGASYVNARHVLVTTGITDKLPDVPGLQELWGTRVFHCPYCHGFEVKNQHIAVVGGLNPRFTLHMTHLLRNWSERISFFLNNTSIGEDELEILAARNIQIIRKPVTKVSANLTSSTGVDISTSDGITKFDACFTGPDFLPNNQLLLDAGCDHENGWVKTSHGLTSQPHLWSAGNVISSPDQVSQAMGAGVSTAISINHALLHEDLEQLP